jgi:hypothetical protein
MQIEMGTCGLISRLNWRFWVCVDADCAKSFFGSTAGRTYYTDGMDKVGLHG